MEIVAFKVKLKTLIKFSDFSRCGNKNFIHLTDDEYIYWKITDINPKSIARELYEAGWMVLDGPNDELAEQVKTYNMLDKL